MSATKIDAVPVSQSSNAAHQVRGAYRIVSGRVEWYVYDCGCGYSSPQLGSLGRIGESTSDCRREMLDDEPVLPSLPSHAKPAHEWGDDPPLCSTRCMRLSALTVDGVPYCIECAEAWFDRIVAIELRPELAEMPFNPANPIRSVLNASRVGRRPLRESPEPASQPVTPDEPHEPEKARPAGQLSLLAPEA